VAGIESPLILPHNRPVIRSTAGGIVIDVRVIPRAARSAIAGVRGDALLVRLNAPPVDGAANVELIALLAATFHVPQRAIAIVAGETSRRKRVRIAGIDARAAELALGR
jgi:uncharacterized protein (TIGR00251 family)